MSVFFRINAQNVHVVWQRSSFYLGALIPFFLQVFQTAIEYTNGRTYITHTDKIFIQHTQVWGSLRLTPIMMQYSHTYTIQYLLYPTLHCSLEPKPLKLTLHQLVTAHDGVGVRTCLLLPVWRQFTPPSFFGQEDFWIPFRIVILNIINTNTINTCTSQ